VIDMALLSVIRRWALAGSAFHPGDSEADGAVAQHDPQLPAVGAVEPAFKVPERPGSVLSGNQHPAAWRAIVPLGNCAGFYQKLFDITSTPTRSSCAAMATECRGRSAPAAGRVQAAVARPCSDQGLVAMPLMAPVGVVEAAPSDSGERWGSRLPPREQDGKGHVGLQPEEAPTALQKSEEGANNHLTGACPEEHRCGPS
jgi:hypothetical protein